MDLSDIRLSLPAIDDYVYFQTSGFSPKPEPVIAEIERWMHFQAQGPALRHVHTQMAALLEETRGKVAQTLNANPDEITLNENATVGINIVANGIDWRPGDNVVLSTHEHPGNRIPWYNLTRRYGVQLRFLPVTNDREQLLDAFADLLDERTRLVSLSHVSRRTGLRFPAAEITSIAHDRGVPVLWDGAQSFGAIPVDVKALNCDFYTFSGHKYIMGPQGTGGLYVRRDRIEWLQPSWIGSHSQKEMDLDGNMTLHDAAKRFEFGTRNLADQAGFCKALTLWESIGWQRIYAQIAAYTARLKAALLTVPNLVLETPLPYEHSSGIVTFHMPGFEASAVTENLFARERILTSTLEASSESVRVSTHVFNTEAEMERLIAALTRIQRNGIG